MSLFNSTLPSATTDQATACGSGGACSTSAVRPVYAVQETPEAFRLTVQLPGVTKDGLEVTAEDSEIRVTGRRGWAQPAGWTALHRETPNATFELTLTHDNAIEAGAIAAELRDGVLQVTLPKREALKPRKIAVN
jgi:HSP20 family protein